jgi:hypothetical protein
MPYRPLQDDQAGRDAGSPFLADKGYDSTAFREACQQRRTEPIIPRRGGKAPIDQLDQSVIVLGAFSSVAAPFEVGAS